jgi:GNAT superfamily N-acetyltransferase
VTEGAPRIRAAIGDDIDAVRAIFAAAVDGGDTLSPAPGTADATFDAYWRPPGTRVYVAEVEGRIAGSSLLRANTFGLGDHVANAGFIVDPAMRGRGIASALCAHAIETARGLGYRAMQFNYVVSANATAVRLWQRHGFAVVGRIPKAFRHVRLGEVDVLVMHRFL